MPIASASRFSSAKRPPRARPYACSPRWPRLRSSTRSRAYSTRFGLDGFVTRLRSLNEAQRFLNASIPLVASINGKLPGFLLGETNGHLLVIRGFDASGDVITNDPAVKTDEDARKVYRRA